MSGKTNSATTAVNDRTTTVFDTVFSLPNKNSACSAFVFVKHLPSAVNKKISLQDQFTRSIEALNL